MLYFPQQPWGTDRSDRQTKLFLTLVWVDEKAPYWGQGPLNSLGHAQPSRGLVITKHCEMARGPLPSKGHCFHTASGHCQQQMGKLGPRKGKSFA